MGKASKRKKTPQAAEPPAPPPAGESGPPARPAGGGWGWLYLFLLLGMAWPLFHATTTDRHMVAIGRLAEPARGTPREPSPVILREMAQDGYIWNRHALHLGEDGRLRLKWTDFDNHPEGRPVHWSSGFAWWLRGLGEARNRFFAPHESLQTSIARMSIWANPILLALFVPLIGGLAAWRFGPLAGSTLVVAMVSTQSFYEGFLPAYPDHHGLIAVTLLGTVLGLAWAGAGWIHPGGERHDLVPPDARTARTGVWISAAFGAAGFWISALSQAMLMVGVGVGALVAARVFARGLRREDGAVYDPGIWRFWGLAGGSFTAIFYLIEYFPSAPMLRLEVNHPLYSIAWWGGAMILAALGGWLAAPELRLGAFPWKKLVLPAVALVPIPLSVFIWREQVHIGLDPFFTHLGTFIAELKPLLWRFETKTLTWEVAFGILPYVFAIVLALLIQPSVSRSAKTLLLFLSGPLLLITALQFYQTRWGMLASPPGVLLTAMVVVVLASMFPPSPGGRLARTLLLAGAFLLAVSFPWRVTHQEIAMALQPPEQQLPSPNEALHLVHRDIAEAIRRDAGDKPVVLLSSPNSSAMLGVMGDFRTLGTLYWENVAGLEAAARLLCAQGDDRALELMKRHGVTHVALISWENFIPPYFDILQGIDPGFGVLEKSFGFRALYQKTIPHWARAIPYPESPVVKKLGLDILLLAVEPGQTPLEARYHLAAYLLARNQVEAAEGQLRAILAAQPEAAPARLLLARILMQSGRTTEALQEAQRALPQIPGPARQNAVLDLASDAVRRGQFGPALEVFAAGRLNPAESPLAANFWAWLLSTAPEARLRNAPRALQLLAEIEAAGKADAVPFKDTKAAALAAAGRFAEAVALSEELLRDQTARNRAEETDITLERLERYRAGRIWDRP